MKRSDSQPPRPVDIDLDLSREVSDDYAAAWARRRSMHTTLIAVGVALCFIAGTGVGFILARYYRVEPQPADPTAAHGDLLPDTSPPAISIEPEVQLEQRLLDLAIEEAELAVFRGVGNGRQVQQATPPESVPSDEVHVRIRSSTGGVRVTSGGSEVQPVAPSVYQVRRSQPVEVEFSPSDRESEDLERLQIQITPWMDLEQVDPYGPAHQ